MSEVGVHIGKQRILYSRLTHIREKKMVNRLYVELRDVQIVTIVLSENTNVLLKEKIRIQYTPVS